MTTRKKLKLWREEISLKMPVWGSIQFSSVQFSRVVSDSLRPHGTAHQASLYITNSRSSFKLTSIKLVMPSSHFMLCRHIFLLSPISPSIRVFSNESPLRMRWPKYWSFSFSIIPSKEHPGLISFRMNWLDLLAVQDSQESSPTSHMLTKWCSKFSKWGFNSIWNENFQMFKLDLEKAEETEIKLPTSFG